MSLVWYQYVRREAETIKRESYQNTSWMLGFREWWTGHVTKNNSVKERQGTTDSMFIIWQMIEKQLEYQKVSFWVFIDPRKSIC